MAVVLQTCRANVSKIASLRLFVVTLCILISLHGITFANMAASVSTLQKLFGFSSFQTGVWMSSFEIGHITAVVLGSYFGSTRHKPRIIFLGSLACALSCFIHAAPHFAVNYSSDYNYHVNSSTSQANPQLCVAGKFFNSTVDCKDRLSHTTQPTSVIAVYIIAAIIMGTGFAPTHTLGLIYVDDNVSDKSKSSFLIGIIMGMNALGPVIGFAFCAFAFSIDVNLRETESSLSGPPWIGAWWLGYMVSGTLIFATSFLLLLFPKDLCYKPPVAEIVQSTNEHLTNTDGTSNIHSAAPFSSNIKELIPTLKEISQNSLFLCVGIAASAGSWMIGGFYTLLPKYFEVFYQQSAALASIETGVSGPLVSCLSILLSGWITSKLKLTIKQSAAFAICTNTMAVLFMAASLMCDCTQHPIVRSSGNCSSVDCDCPPEQYAAVCSRGTTFYSPCHAGCTNFSAADSDAMVYTRCGCDDATATPGLCEKECWLLVPYIIVITIATALPCVSSMATLNIVLRCVKEEHRSIGLGLQSMLVSVLGFIPAPVAFGAVFDSTCALWHHLPCMEEDSECLEYDNAQLRIKYHGLVMGCDAIACIFGMAAWHFANRKETAAGSNDEELRTSTSSSENNK